MARLKVGVLISGPRLEPAGADRRRAPTPTIRPRSRWCISNRPDARRLERARHAPASRTARSPHPDRASLRRRGATRALREAGVELVALAGFMRILDTGFVERWRDRLDQHPPLAAARVPRAPPAAPGARRRGAVFRLHRAFRPRRGRYRADHRPGRRAGAAGRRRGPLADAHPRRRAPRSTRWRCGFSPRERAVVRGATAARVEIAGARGRAGRALFNPADALRLLPRRARLRYTAGSTARTAWR